MPGYAFDGYDDSTPDTMGALLRGGASAAYGYGQQPSDPNGLPPGLSLADLMLRYQVPQVDYPSAPNLPGSLNDLSEEDRRRIAKRSLLTMGASAFAGGPGTFGAGLLRGAGAAMDEQDRAVAGARQDALQQYAIQRQAATEQAQARAAQMQQQQGNQQGQGILGSYNQVRDMLGTLGADPITAKQLEAQARAAALAGDHGAVLKILATAPQTIAAAREVRQEEQRRGLPPGSIDPQDFQTQQRYQIQADAEKQRQLDIAKQQYQYRLSEIGAEKSSRGGEVRQDSEGNYILIDPRAGTSRPVTGSDGSPLSGHDSGVSKYVSDAQRSVFSDPMLMGASPEDKAAAIMERAKALQLVDQQLRQPAKPPGAAARGGLAGASGLDVHDKTLAQALPPEILAHPGVVAQAKKDLAAGKTMAEILAQMRAAGLIQ